MGRYTGKKCRLISMFGLTGSFFLVEIIVGYVTNSMALVADSFHMLSDIAALVIAFVSVKMAPKSWDKNTYGWARAEVLGALINAVFLVALCFSITVESFKRFYEPEDIHNPDMILFVGTMGLLVNLVGLCLFHQHGTSHQHETNDRDFIDSSNKSLSNYVPDKKGIGHQHDSSQMNMRGVFLHVLADALGSVVVIVSALIMWLTDWDYKLYVDPGLSLVLVILMMHSVWPLLIESALILLQTVPTHLDIEKLKKKLLDEIDEILAIHDFHIWQLAGNRIIASAHIRCLNLSEYMKVAEKVKEFFHHEGIHSTTIQPEFVDTNDQNDDCVLSCPVSKTQESPNCQNSKCCLPLKENTSFGVDNKPANTNKELSNSSDEIRIFVDDTSYDQCDDTKHDETSMLDNSHPSNDVNGEVDLGFSCEDMPEETLLQCHNECAIKPKCNTRVVKIISQQSNI